VQPRASGGRYGELAFAESIGADGLPITRAAADGSKLCDDPGAQMPHSVTDGHAQSRPIADEFPPSYHETTSFHWHALHRQQVRASNGAPVTDARGLALRAITGNLGKPVGFRVRSFIATRRHKRTSGPGESEEVHKLKGRGCRPPSRGRAGAEPTKFELAINLETAKAKRRRQRARV